MPKICNTEDCNNPRFGGGYCLHHQHLRTDKKPKPLKRTRIKTQRTKISPVSTKKSRQLARYRRKRDEYMKNNQICECYDCVKPAQDLHHKAGRGIHTDNPEHFMAVCRSCHDRIHLNPDWARSHGYLITLNTKQ